MTDSLSRGRLAAMALLRLGGALVVMPALLFASAGTFAYPEAWGWLAVVFLPMLGFAGVLLVRDPVLLERRMRAREERPRQALIVRVGALGYLLTFLLPGFDHRFGWSDVPVATVLAADAGILLSYGLFILTLNANRYASRVVEVAAGQSVIAAGPYGWIRHPMYLAALGMMLLTPVALGSWWALLPASLLVGVFVARIRDEERLLEGSLDGYREYERTTRYRLVPGLW